MNKNISIKIDSESSEIYNKFKNQVGSQHIASPVTIAVLSEICRVEKPKRILEIGGGIGTISYTLLKNSNAFIDIYEDNDFCINKLNENLAQFSGRFNIINSYHILPPVREYDLMIIDGGSGNTNDVQDGGETITTWLFIKYLENVKSIYFEGRRKLQQIMVYKALFKNYKIEVMTYSDSINSQGIVYKGGTKIKCEKCLKGIIRWISFAKSISWGLVRKPLIYRIGRIKDKLLVKGIK